MVISVQTAEEIDFKLYINIHYGHPLDWLNFLSCSTEYLRCPDPWLVEQCPAIPTETVDWIDFRFGWFIHHEPSDTYKLFNKLRWSMYFSCPLIGGVPIF